MIKKLVLYSTLLSSLGLSTINVVNAAEKPVISNQENVKNDINMNKEWEKAKKAGYSRSTFERIMSIPNQKNCYPISTYDSGTLNSQQKAIINEAKKYIGVPYVWGGSTPDGFDCSGLVQYVYKHAINLDLPRVTTQQELCGQEVSLNDIQPGDLLFWGPKGNSYHVAIYIGNGQYIQAPQPGQNVQYGDMKYYTPSFARRVISVEPDGPVYHKTNQYVKINKEGYTLWRDLDFKEKKGSTDGKLGTMYNVQAYYTHPNGQKYLSLYDKNNVWQGYVNEAATEYTSQFGEYKDYQKYVTINKTGYHIWQDKYFKKSNLISDDVYQKTYKAKGYYDLFDGSRYLSLYDNSDQWIGYIRETATKLAAEDGNSAGGAAISKESYVKINKDGYTLWRDLNFKEKKGTTDNLVGKVYNTTCYYNHINGQRYLSIYDKDNKWIGYLNSSAATYTDSQFGDFHSQVKKVKVVKKGYNIWQDKYFKKSNLASDNVIGKTYTSKGYYDLFDGSRYLSLYDNNDQWIGYIREGAVQEVK